MEKVDFKALSLIVVKPCQRDGERQGIVLVFDQPTPTQLLSSEAAIGLAIKNTSPFLGHNILHHHCSASNSKNI